MTEASVEEMTAARQEHLVPGREIHLRDMRGYRFCEVGLITGSSETTAIANIWNTTGACDPTPEQIEALDAATIAAGSGTQAAWLSPPTYWMFDRLDVRQAGDDRTFGGITGTWMGMTSAATLLRATGPGSYYPAYVYRDKTFTYHRGSEVYVLDAPDGEMFIMLSIARRRDSTLSEHDLRRLAGRLDLPDGWGFHAETLDQDMAVSSNPDNLAHVVRDSLGNVYQGSDVGRSFSGLWPRNPPR